jgi:hypothetical protein
MVDVWLMVGCWLMWDDEGWCWWWLMIGSGFLSMSNGDIGFNSGTVDWSQICNISHFTESDFLYRVFNVWLMRWMIYPCIYVDLVILSLLVNFLLDVPFPSVCSLQPSSSDRSEHPMFFHWVQDPVARYETGFAMVGVHGWLVMVGGL